MYDIYDMYEPALFAILVETIIKRIKSARKIVGSGPVVTAQLGKHVFKVNNSLNGFVSCTNEDEGRTGVSRTMHYPYEDDSECGLKNLIEMINESWFACERND